jgi:preprotein translocase SecE subunit
VSKIADFVQYLRDVRSETERVQWPEPRQTMLTTVAVVVFVVVTSLFLAGTDFLLSLAMEALFR